MELQVEGETKEEFRARMRSVGYIGRRSGPLVEEGVDPKLGKFKATTDELKNTVIESGTDRQDVIIRAPHVMKTTSTIEVR